MNQIVEMELFRKKNWKFDPRGVEQCRDGASFSDAEKHALSEGCQIYGSLEVNRVINEFFFKPKRQTFRKKMDIYLGIEMKVLFIKGS
jgi:hypothetical protein